VLSLPIRQPLRSLAPGLPGGCGHPRQAGLCETTPCVFSAFSPPGADMFERAFPRASSGISSLAQSGSGILRSPATACSIANGTTSALDPCGVVADLRSLHRVLAVCDCPAAASPSSRPGLRSPPPWPSRRPRRPIGPRRAVLVVDRQLRPSRRSRPHVFSSVVRIASGRRGLAAHCASSAWFHVGERVEGGDQVVVGGSGRRPARSRHPLLDEAPVHRPRPRSLAGPSSEHLAGRDSLR